MADDTAAAPPPAPNTEIMFCGECKRARMHVHMRLQAREDVPDLKLVKGTWFAFWKCQTCGYAQLTKDIRVKVESNG